MTETSGSMIINLTQVVTFTVTLKQKISDSEQGYQTYE